LLSGGGPVSATRTSEGDAVGQVLLANGDIWRFAFRSHHRIGGLNSYAVFNGPLGTFRVRGDYFCCEVQFPGDAPPEDSTALVTFLKRVNNSVQQVE
jgi:hypothetical protein